MARRRMITLDIYDSDSFLDMPTEAQNLFTHFVARADDDGFISNPKRIRRMLGYGEDSFTLLIAKGYIYEFTSGFVVVAAWRSMNRVEPSKKTQTTAKYELAQLTEVNKIYELAENADIEAFTDDTRKILENRGLTSRKALAQVRLGKVRLGKDRLEEVLVNDKSQKTSSPPPTTPEMRIANFFRGNGFGEIGPHIGQELTFELNDFDTLTKDREISADIIIMALSRAVENGVTTWNYAKQPLKDWFSKGLKSVEDINALELKRRNQKKKKGNYVAPPVKEARPDFEGQNAEGVSQEELANAQAALEELDSKFNQTE